ncbi:MAG TPA: M56 family metallopeptidase [Pirellulales bacterium]
MHALTVWFSAAWSSAWAPLAVDVIVKATVLLLLSMLAAAIWRRSSAAVRHRVWCLAFAALLLLPALSAGLPEWRLEVLPYSSPLAPREDSGNLLSPNELASPRTQRATLDEDGLVRERFMTDSPTFAAPGGPLAERDDYFTPALDPDTSGEPIVSEPTDGPRQGRGPWVLAAFWLLGAIIAGSPLAAGVLRNYLLRRRAQPVAEAAWTSLLDELRARLCLRRRVALYETRAALMPMTWGMLSPIVMLPHAAREWTERLRRFVLLHELAHVKRCDVGFQMLARLACALYWFHPLAWYALRRLRIERELACDDCVVQAGERPSDYAAELLAIARHYRPLRLAAAVPMAQTSNLERRIRALFDKACSHLPISPRAARLLLLGTALIVTTVAVIRLAPRAVAEADEPSDVAQPPSAGAPSPAATDKQPVAAVPQGQPEPQAADPPSAKAPKSQDDVISVRGRVLDPAGKPLPGARVRVIHVDTEWITWIKKGRLLAETKSNGDGAFTIDVRDTVSVATGEHFLQPSTVVLADMPGKGFDWSSLKPGGEPLSLQLVDDAAIEGRILDLEGHPIAGVRVSVNEVSGGATDLDSWIEKAKSNPVSLDPDQMMRPIKARNKNPGPTVAHYPGNKNLQLGAPELMPSAVTGRDGKFRLVGLGRDRQVRLQLDGAGIAKTWLTVVTHDMPPVPYPGYDPRFRVQTCFGRRFDLTAEPEQHITGVIRDAHTGEPLPGVEVRLTRYSDSLLFVEGFLSATTDEQGRYLLRGVPKPNHPERTHCLRLLPATGEPYFRTEANPPKKEGLGPVSFDVALKRAIRVHGQVSDATTGDPVRGLVAYYPFLSNKAAADFSNFNSGLLSVGNDDWYTTDQDGRYEFPVLPGRGIVMFAAWQGDRYAEAEGAEAIADLYQADGKRLNIYHLLGLEAASAVREIDAAQTDTVFDIKLRRLDATEIEFVDPAGNPLVGVVTRRLVPVRLAAVGDRTSEWSRDALPTAVAELIGAQDQSRTAMFAHRQKKLAAVLRLFPKAAPPNRVVLRPCAAIVGRVIDHRGMPVSDFEVSVNAASEPGVELEEGWKYATLDRRHQLAILVTDRDGNFHIDSVPPGVAYVLSDANHRSKLQKTTPVVQPGETLDLGDLALKTPVPAEEKTGANAKLDTSSRNADEKPTSAKDKPTPRSSSSPGDASIVTLRGQVVDPSGKPFAGAKLYLSYPILNDLKEQLLGASGEEGRFEFSIDRGELDVSRLDDPWKLARLTAVAEGFGFDWIDASKATNDCTLRLVDDVPIHGRILTLEGQPVAGAEIKLRQVQVPTDGGIDEYLKMFRAGEVYQFQRQVSQRVPGLRVAATTDDEGRFTLRGLGAERVVELMVAGPGIESWFVTAITRESKPTERPARWNNTHVYGASFDHLAMPSQKIVGIVRDRKTKQPVADVEVRGSRTVRSAKTDAEGRFELLGERKEKEHRLSVLPPAPYFGTQISVTAAGPMDLPPVEIALDRGLEARGQVVVRPSGERATGRVDYFPLWPNKHVTALGPQPGGLPAACRGTAMIRPDGSYSISVLPGPGVLGFITSKQHAPAYLSRDDIDRFFGDGQNHGDENSLMVESGNFGPRPQMQKLYHALMLINPAEDATELTVDASVEAGRTLTGTVVDPAGAPLAGVKLRGPQNPIAPELLDAPQFSLTGLDPRRPGELIFEHRARRLGALRRVTGDETQPIEVRLAPCGSLTGRLLDDDGEPMPAAKLSLGRSGYFPHDFALETDGEGRFRIDTLVPGLSYDLALGSGASFLQRKIIVASGEVKDLGEVRLKPSGEREQASAVNSAAQGTAVPPKAGTGQGAKETMPRNNEGNTAAPRASSDAPITLGGRVLLPEGVPAAGAALYWPTIHVWPPRASDDIEYRKRAETDATGRFELRLAAEDRPKARHPLSLLALKGGYGLAWLDVKRDEQPDEITLRLVADNPIRGRLTDTEGRAVVGARVAVNAVLDSSTRNVDGFLRAFKQDWNLAWNKLDRRLYAPLGAIVGAVTDAQGRFELSGVGVERVAEVEIAPRGFMSDEIRVVNRPGFEAAEFNQAMLNGMLPQMRKRTNVPRLCGPVVDFVAEAEWVLRGAVFTAPSRTPVVGAVVSSFAGGWGHTVSAVTGADGQYELRGLPRHQEALLGVAPPEETDLLPRTLSVPPAPAETVTKIDVELKHGIVVKGRVYDQATERGLDSGVRFVPLPGNSFVNQAGFDGYLHDRTMHGVDAEGRFRLVIIPGPGVLTAQVHGGEARVGERAIKPYRIASLTKDDRERVAPTEDDDGVVFTAADNSIESLSIENAAKVIDASPDATELTCDLPVDPGKTAQIAIEDEQGGPLTGAFVAGVTESWPITYKIDEPVCTVYALGEDRPRRLCLLHPERHLAGGVTLTGDEHEIVTVRLGAAASIAGRALDESGAPVADAVVQINYARAIARELDRFATLDQPAVKTDADGRFQIGDIVPGERFALDFKQDDHYFRAHLSDDQRTLQTGQKLELGDIKTRQLR